jgi:putative transposase
VKYGFMRAHRDQFKVSRMCQAFDISRSGYYSWRDRKESKCAGENRRVLAEIYKVHERSKQAYGTVKTWRELKAQGMSCGRHRWHGSDGKRESKLFAGSGFASQLSRAGA